jgi:hypothetical protein
MRSQLLRNSLICISKRITPADVKFSILTIDNQAQRGSRAVLADSSANARNTAIEAAGRYIFAGWFTPDYETWFRGLEASLIAAGVPCDFQAAPKEPGAWERNTRRKHGFIPDTMNRYSGRIIIWIGSTTPIS